MAKSVFMSEEKANECLEGLNCRRMTLEGGDIPSNKEGILVEEYRGRFGVGYKVHFPIEINTGFHAVGYYVK